MENAENFEKEHVEKVYNEIAPHFSQTRTRPWPFVEKFLKSQKDDSLVADVGCGNGKYFFVNNSKKKLILDSLFNKKEITMIGSDLSEGLIKICRDRNLQCFVADGLLLPYRSNTFDSAISIAVIHHFSTIERRIQSIQELSRIIKPNGLILIYVWAFEQEKYEKKNEQDVFISWELQKKYQKENEIYETNEDGKVIFQRYYHLFKKNELENLILKCGNLEIIESEFENNNWIVVCKKLK
eukprot:gene11306-4117_t